MTKFEELQAMHEQLMEQSKSPEDVTAFVEEVQREIHNMCVAAEDIPAPRERDQLRAILRFWASYVYDQTGTYPDTTLHPANSAPPRSPVSDHTRSRLLMAFAAGAVLIVLLILIGSLTQTLPRLQAATSTPGSSANVSVTTEPALPVLQIQWNILTAGPSPFNAQVWAIKIQLSARGGNGSYIFWANGEHLPDVNNNQFTVEGQGCDPQKPVVGVTSGGQAASLELVIQSPLPNCPSP